MRKAADVRKAEIVATVLRLADRIGPDRVTTVAVATEIGVTQAALFRHFPTKAALWQTVADTVAEQLSQAWAEALAGAKDPAGQIRALVAAQCAQIIATPALPMLLFSRELNVENEGLRAAFRGRLAAFHGHLCRAFAEGQAQGQFRADLAADDAAVLVSSLVQGGAIRWVLGARDFDLGGEGLRLLAVQLRLFAAQEG